MTQLLFNNKVFLDETNENAALCDVLESVLSSIATDIASHLETSSVNYLLISETQEETLRVAVSARVEQRLAWAAILTLAHSQLTELLFCRHL